MDADGPRLCLVLWLEHPLPTPDAVIDVLQALDAPTLVLAKGDASCIEVEALSSIVKAAQEKGVAVLVENDTALAKKLAADGVHLAWCKEPLESFEVARQALGPDRIVGADVGRSRHDAMEVGEAGADYVAFGIPAMSRIGRPHSSGSWISSRGGSNCSRCRSWRSMRLSRKTSRRS